MSKIMTINFIHCKSFPELSKLKSLVELYLFPNKFIGVSPSMLEWTSLKRLYIYESEFNGTALEGNNCFIFQNY